MRGTQRIVVSAWLALATSGYAASTGQVADSTSWLQFIGMELRQLRIEFLEHNLAIETVRLSELERSLTSLQLEQSEARKEERINRQQLANLEHQMEEAGSDPQARTEIQALKAELSGPGAERLRLVQAALASREAELSERLRIARARLQALADRLKRLIEPQH